MSFDGTELNNVTCRGQGVPAPLVHPSRSSRKSVARTRPLLDIEYLMTVLRKKEPGCRPASHDQPMDNSTSAPRCRVEIGCRQKVNVKLVDPLGSGLTRKWSIEMFPLQPPAEDRGPNGRTTWAMGAQPTVTYCPLACDH